MIGGRGFRPHGNVLVPACTPEILYSLLTVVCWSAIGSPGASGNQRVRLVLHCIFAFAPRNNTQAYCFKSDAVYQM